MRGLAAATLAIAVCACAPPGPKGVDTVRLDEAIGRAIGDPGTCVLLAKRGSGDIVYRYGAHMTCARSLPSCQGGGKQTVNALKDAAAKGDERTLSCPSSADRSRGVAWASGPVQPGEGAQYGDLVYAAVMEGERTLPGREIALRLERAFSQAGM